MLEQILHLAGFVLLMANAFDELLEAVPVYCGGEKKSLFFVVLNVTKLKNKLRYT